MAKLKVYHWLGMTDVKWEERPWVGQVDCIVAAKSMAEVARLMGEKSPRSLFNLSETWNDEDKAVAMSKPGTIFWRHLGDHVTGEWKEGRP